MAPLFMASAAKRLPLKFSPFRAKNMQPGVMFLESVDINRLLRYKLYSLLISIFYKYIPKRDPTRLKAGSPYISDYYLITFFCLRLNYPRESLRSGSPGHHAILLHQGSDGYQDLTNMPGHAMNLLYIPLIYR